MLVPRIILAASFAVLAVAVLHGTATAQPHKPQVPPKNDSTTAQLVDSRKGYVMRLPSEAILDSARSGTSRDGLFEQRVYAIKGAGYFRISVTVGPQQIPDSAKEVGPYRYTTRDSATPGGTAMMRTYFLPTRRVGIEIVPAGIKMRRWLDASERIYGTFRWKPGANTDAVDTDPPLLDPSFVPSQPKSGGLDG